MLVLTSQPPAAAAPPVPVPAPALPKLTLSPGGKWMLVSQSVHVFVSLANGGSIRGTVEFRVRLVAPIDEIRLNCAPTCVVHRCLLDGETITLDDGSAVPQPVVPVADGLAECVVPPHWRRTRDLGSFERCHGAATFVGSHQHWDEPRGAGYHAGELAVPLPQSAREASRGSAEARAAGSAEEAPEVTLSVEYSVREPRGGVHFVCPPDSADAVYAHTVAEFGAVRRWMPCVDCPQVRCPMTLHVTADAQLQVHAGGRALRVTTAPPSSGGAPPLRTWGFELEGMSLAGQVGFVVGHLSSLRCAKSDAVAAPAPRSGRAAPVVFDSLPWHPCLPRLRTRVDDR